MGDAGIDIETNNILYLIFLKFPNLLNDPNVFLGFIQFNSLFLF